MSLALAVPAELAEIIATHRREFGGDWTMLDDQITGGRDAARKQCDDAKAGAEKGSGKAEDGGKPAEDWKSEHSKASVLAELAQERKARQKLEADVQKFQASSAQLEKLDKIAEVFAPEKKGDKSDLSETIIARLEKIELKAAANELARKHGITSDEDVALLMGISDAKTREALAARIAPAKGDANDHKPARKGDPALGKGGTQNSGGSSVAAGRTLYESIHPTKKH